MLRLQEGPHSTLPEDEFFDAVESGLDKIEEDRQLRVRLKLQSQQQVRLILYRCITLPCIHEQNRALFRLDDCQIACESYKNTDKHRYKQGCCTGNVSVDEIPTILGCAPWIIIVIVSAVDIET